jgi:hypothetical protein
MNIALDLIQLCHNAFDIHHASWWPQPVLSLRLLENASFIGRSANCGLD